MALRWSGTFLLHLASPIHATMWTLLSLAATRRLGLGALILSVLSLWSMDLVAQTTLRGQVLEGTVSGVGMQKTITIERRNVRYMEKYERFEKRTSALSAHLPSCIGDVNVGDTVKIMECRPLSKTISFCVIEHTGGEA